MDNELSRRSVLRNSALVAGATIGAGLMPWNAKEAMADSTPGRPSPDLRELFTALRAEWPNNRTINLVWHGHSVPAGYHLTPEVKPFESYPFMVYQGLKQRYPTAVVNSITTAIGGENSVQGAARFKSDVLPHRPDLLFIDYTINDRGKPLDTVEAAWRSMIETAQRRRLALILLTPTGTRFDNLADPENVLSIRAALIRSLGAEYGLPVADNSTAWQQVLDEGTDQETLLAQGVHPNGKGHEIAAGEILTLIDVLRARTR